jgi:hypothetical protein
MAVWLRKKFMKALRDFRPEHPLPAWIVESLVVRPLLGSRMATSNHVFSVFSFLCFFLLLFPFYWRIKGDCVR